MSTWPSTSEVVLPDGGSVSVAALRLLRSLEARGFVLAVRDHRLFVAPRGHLTIADDDAIRRQRDDLCALVSAHDRRCVA
jgi:hypothetical protein